MKFKATTKDLVSTLQESTAIVNLRSVIPIFGEVKFDLKGSSLCLTSSDQQNTLVKEIGVEGDQDGAVCLDGKKLLGILKTLKDPMVELALSGKRVKLIASVGVFEIPVSDAKDYPNLPELKESKTFSIDSSVLYEGITKTILGVARDSMRVLDYLLFRVEDRKVIFVGCDSNNLYEHKTDVEVEDNFSILLDPKSATIIKSYADGEEVHISYSENYIFLSFTNAQLYCRLGEGKYVDYSGVIPKESSNYALINRANMIAAIKRSLILANRTSHSVKMDFSTKGISISSEDIDFNTRAEESVSGTFYGEDIRIMLSGVKVIDALNSIDTENAKMELTSPNRPVVIRPEGEVEYLGLTMPLMLD
ncbi:DNA polymerase III subunit beta [Sphingobacterium sp. LRF_L2]|uniref:DNA polymerase III subunit beta n=1 Tax=Sphingobacterium sp. LRF_L2 TaxID=3369421 RepID=UPI003F620048